MANQAPSTDKFTSQTKRLLNAQPIVDSRADQRNVPLVVNLLLR